MHRNGGIPWWTAKIGEMPCSFARPAASSCSAPKKWMPPPLAAWRLTVQLPLLPSGEYHVRSIMSGKDLGVFTYADWVRGVPFNFLESERVDVLEITPGRSSVSHTEALGKLHHRSSPARFDSDIFEA